MNTVTRSLFSLASLLSIAAAIPAGAAEEQKNTGKEGFRNHCEVCHPNGGNIVKPGKPLKKKALKTNGIKTPADIVRTMRKPPPGMTAFDTQTIGDREAKAIAEYVLHTFK